MKKTPNKQGFTLIELLVVIAIISMLASIIMPVFSKAREKGREAACTSNQRQFSMATGIWAQDNNEKIPDAATVWNDLQLSGKVLICPTKGPKTANGYVYSSFITGKSLGDITEPTLEVLSADGLDNPQTVDGVEVHNILCQPSDVEFRHAQQSAFLASFVDGHVQLMTELPPMWIVDAENAWEMENIVFKTSYPTLVYLYPDEKYSAEPEHQYCELLAPVVIDIAKTYRLKVQVIRLCGDNAPEVLKEYDIVPGDQEKGYPAFLFFKKGKLVDSMSGFPPDVTNWTDTDWQAELALCKKQVTDKLDAMLK
ncbi:MAG TPA: prepilin-type N-terminal cleavage/methylation domain-containing protein [Armatimonadota bacterium]|nr:prepilin-type N-terminal cleavage/methylation domain-containing protein [Armatimonadota bacterium]